MAPEPIASHVPTPAGFNWLILLAFPSASGVGGARKNCGTERPPEKSSAYERRRTQNLRREWLMAHSFDPLEDPRWGTLVERHPNASIFHTRGWLSSLKRTYGFAPVAFTTSPAGTELRNALVMCRVRSWMTGDRLVSLPFSDHCDPLITDSDELDALVLGVDGYRMAGRWKYAEVRPAHCPLPIGPPFGPAKTCYLDRLGLQADIDARGAAVDALS